MNKNLQELWCGDNQLISLPPLNKNLQELFFHNNQLSFLAYLNEKLKKLWCVDNLINEIIGGILPIYETKSIDVCKKQIQTINNFRHLYYSVKFKKQFLDVLWVKIREPKIRKKYHPSNLIENLEEETDLETFLDN